MKKDQTSHTLRTLVRSELKAMLEQIPSRRRDAKTVLLRKLLRHDIRELNQSIRKKEGDHLFTQLLALLHYFQALQLIRS